MYATQTGAHMMLYQEAFLTTYRTFLSSMELLSKLIRRYKLFAPAHRSPEQRKAARQTFSMIVRVVDELWYVHSYV